MNNDPKSIDINAYLYWHLAGHFDSMIKSVLALPYAAVKDKIRVEDRFKPVPVSMNEEVAMPISSELFEEIALLSLFNLDNTQEGLKIHHEAAPARIDAARRLFDKDMITLLDGGYLTGHGVEAAEHTRKLMNLLNS